MAQSPDPLRMKEFILGVTAVLACCGFNSRAWADRIVLRGSGQIHGKLEPDPKHPERVLVTPEKGKTILSFRKDQIADVIAEPSALDEYLPRRNRTSANAQGQYELGLWCESRKLTDLADRHFALAVQHDPEFAPAHQKLGESKVGDRWVKGDALREAQGLVRDHGKWITREEKEERDKDRAAVAQQTSWARQLRVLREALLSGSDGRRLEAEAQLLDIRDPAAVRPLLQLLGDDPSAVRMLLARVLGGIPGPEASRALVRLLLAETESDVRASVLDAIDRREGPEARAELAKALQSSLPEIVNRAAWALSQLQVVTAVPALIKVLVTSRVETVMSPPTFASVTPTPGFISPVNTPSVGSSGYASDSGLPPGVAGYGISTPSLPSLPALPAIPSPAGLATNVGASGGGGLAASRGPTPRLVTVTIQNLEVQHALVRLTGEDFGFDVAAWKRWVRASYQAERIPARHVPQP